jgi:hypothetical protein
MIAYEVLFETVFIKDVMEEELLYGFLGFLGSRVKAGVKLLFRGTDPGYRELCYENIQRGRVDGEL